MIHIDEVFCVVRLSIKKKVATLPEEREKDELISELLLELEQNVQNMNFNGTLVKVDIQPDFRRDKPRGPRKGKKVKEEKEGGDTTEMF